MGYYRRRKHNLKNTFLRLITAIGVAAVGIFMFLDMENASIGGESGDVKGTMWVNYERALEKAKGMVGEWGEEKFSIFNFQFSKDERESGKVNKQVTSKIALLSDSQGDLKMLERILKDISVENVDLLFHLGDLTQGGEREQFLKTRELLDRYQSSGAYESYTVLSGDHDFNWEPEHSLKNYQDVFEIESLDRVVDFQKARFIIWDNANRDVAGDGVNIDRRRWLKNRIGGDLVFVLAHRPFYSPYFKSRVDPRGRDVLKLSQQAAQESGAQVVTLSGDTHSYARYTDSETGIENVTVGAAGSYKNFLPMWVLLTVYDDGSYKIEPQPLTDLVGE